MLHTEFSLIGIGILKCEWAVLPHSSNSAAIPEDATANAIFPMSLTVDSNVSMRNVFHNLLEHLEKTFSLVGFHHEQHS